MQMIKISCIMGRTRAVTKWIYDRIYQSKLRSTQTIPLSNKHLFRAHKKRTQAVTWGSWVPLRKRLLSVLTRHLFCAVFCSHGGHLATFAHLCGPLSSVLWIRGPERETSGPDPGLCNSLGFILLLFPRMQHEKSHCSPLSWILTPQF